MPETMPRPSTPKPSTEGIAETPRFLVGELATLSLKPRDVLVLMSNEILSESVKLNLKEAIERHIPGHTCIVLEEGLRLGVISPEN